MEDFEWLSREITLEIVIIINTKIVLFTVFIMKMDLLYTSEMYIQYIYINKSK